MNDASSGHDPQPTSPGEVRPGRTLDRPPSARYVTQPGQGSEGGPGGEAAGNGRRGTGTMPAVRIAILGAIAIVVLNAVLSVTTGLIAVTAVTSYLIGQALRTGGASGGAPSAGRIVLALGLAILAVLAGAAGAWLVAIPQGNVLGPVEYLGQTLGVVLPLQVVIAIVGTWLGSR